MNSLFQYTFLRHSTKYKSSCIDFDLICRFFRVQGKTASYNLHWPISSWWEIKVCGYVYVVLTSTANLATANNLMELVLKVMVDCKCICSFQKVVGIISMVIEAKYPYNPFKLEI
jgi:hypothetical protein